MRASRRWASDGLARSANSARRGWGVLGSEGLSGADALVEALLLLEA